MAKFWRSGMIDKKIVREREQDEYINKLHRTILELSREEPEPKYATVYTSDNRSHKVKIADDYDEVRVGDNVILDFGNDCIIAAPKDSVSKALLDFNKQFITKTPKTPVKDAIVDSCSYWMRKDAEKRYETDIKFSRKVEEIINENNTRTLRQEE